MVFLVLTLRRRGALAITFFLFKLARLTWRSLPEHAFVLDYVRCFVVILAASS